MAEDRYILVTSQGELSLAEAVAYLDQIGIRYRVEGVSDWVVILHASGLDAEKTMERLGGLFKIGGMKCVLDEEDLKNADRMRAKLDAAEFYGWVDDKARWSISTYRDETGFDPDLPDFLQQYFKQRLKRDHVTKARYVPPKRIRETDQEVIADELVRRGIIEGGLEIIAAHLSSRYHVGRTLKVVPNQRYRQRDLGRPVQNPRLSIPPKVARILLNLTGLEAGETLLDPFCGIGTILQEAAILGLRITGCDIDARRVSETMTNLKWLTQTYGLQIDGLGKRVFQADARRLSEALRTPVDGIATEPILLPPLKQYPSENQATRMLQEAAETYEEAVPAMAAVLKKRGRLVLVAPYIQTGEGSEVSFNLEEVFEEAGLRPHQFPNLPSLGHPMMAMPARDQKVRRGVYVLERR